MTIDIHKAIGKLPIIPKRGFVLPNMNYCGAYNPLDKQLIYDKNGNIKTISNDEYLHFSNKVIVYEDIFINFTKNVKKIKFIIKFQKLSSSRVIYVYYMKNDNYRFILKHYSM